MQGSSEWMKKDPFFFWMLSSALIECLERRNKRWLVIFNETIVVYLIISSVQFILFRKKMLVSRVDPSSFSPKVELVGLLTAASYKGLFPGSDQPTAPSCFLRHQPDSPASAASGFSTFCQQSKARKQCVQAVYRCPGPGSSWGTIGLPWGAVGKNGPLVCRWTN